MAKVSIIVAVYNVKEKFFDKCIYSILGQTLKDIEIILIDDGSVKECADLCDKFANKDSRIIVKHKKNEGVSIASNLGIKMSNGEYIMFVDNDDWIEENTCEVLYQTAKNDSADVVVFNYNSYTEKDCIKAYYKGPDYKTYTGKEEINKLQMQILDPFALEEQQISLAGANWGKFYKAEVLKNNLEARFPEGMMGGEDSIFTFKALNYANKVSFINKYFYYYRQNEFSYTKRFKEKMLNDELRMLKVYNELVRGNEIFTRLYGKMACNSFVGLCVNFLFHPENKMSYGEKRSYLKNVLDIEIYSNAIKAYKTYGFKTMKKMMFAFANIRMVDFVLAATYVYACKTRESMDN